MNITNLIVGGIIMFLVGLFMGYIIHLLARYEYEKQFKEWDCLVKKYVVRE